MSKTLPDFDHPPLTEVVLGVQFEPIPGFLSAHAGLLWQRFRDEFPEIDEKPPLVPIIERFGGKMPKHPVELRITEVQEPTRHWFLSSTGDQLIQVQRDRLLHNWRKQGEGAAYPRYPSIRSAFKRELAVFQVFLDEQGWGLLQPNQCEITYVNHILPTEAWERHGQMGEILTVFEGAYSDDGLGEPEDAKLSLRYTMQEEGSPKGRLHITAAPGYRRSDQQPLVNLQLTARGQPSGEDIDGILAFLDCGREWIVRGFTSITTPKMHRLWGKRDA